MKRLVLFTVAAMLLVAPRSEAAFFTGALDYDYNAPALNTGAFDFSVATTIVAGTADLDPGTVPGDFNDVTGELSTVASQVGSFAAFNYAAPAAISPWLSFTGANSGLIEFYVTSFSVSALVPQGVFIIDGLGYFLNNGDITLGAFTLTGSQVGAGGTQAIQVGGTIAATGPPQDVVPEPASMLLLGSGLVGMAAAARRRRKQS